MDHRDPVRYFQQREHGSYNDTFFSCQITQTDQYRKCNDIEPYFYNRSGTVHKASVQHCKIKLIRTTLVSGARISESFLSFQVYPPEKKAERDRYDVQDQHRRHHHFFIADHVQHDIIDDKAGTYIIAERQQIGAFFPGDPSLPHQIRRRLRTGRIPAQEPGQHGESAVSRCGKYSRGQPSEQGGYDRQSACGDHDP